jgi:KTSC domain-containing protein
MPYLQSVAIEALAYDEEAHLLKARFRADGKIMIYENVPPDVYDSLIFADSISTYFRDHIEGAYPAREAPRGRIGKPS